MTDKTLIQQLRELAKVSRPGSAADLINRAADRLAMLEPEMHFTERGSMEDEA
jgi:hypothetical protein